MKSIKHLLILLAFLSVYSCEKFDKSTHADTFFHVKINGTELPVWVKGNTASEKFIIYINGGPGLTSLDVARADMFDWSKGLEEKFAMVYYDQRGCGNAQGNFEDHPKVDEGPDQSAAFESTLTIYQCVKDLDAIISVLNHKYDNPEIFLMGHSFGSFIGTNFLLTDNLEDKISGWISIDGAYNFDYAISWQYRRIFLINIANEEIAAGRNVKHWSEALNWANVNPEITTDSQKQQWSEFIGQPGGIIIPEELANISVKDYLNIGFTSSYNIFPAYLSKNLQIVNEKLNAGAEGMNLISAVSAIKLPTLFLWGKYDDLIVPEEGMDVFNNFGTPATEKEFILFEKSSHEPYISAPDKFQTDIINFVEKH